MAPPLATGMKPTKEEQFWMYVCLIGAALGFYLVATEVFQGLFLGYVCVWNLGAYAEKHFGEKPKPAEKAQPSFRAISWREEYIRLKGWDAMNDIHRRVITGEFSSPSAINQGTRLMKEELVELKAKYPEHGSFVDIE